jgi:iron complex outermembrane receptor protein
MTTFNGALLACLFALLGPAASPAAAQGGRVAGTVVDATGTALAGAAIVFTGAGSGQMTSNDAGEFVTAGLPAGTYTFTATLDGFAPGYHTVTVAEGEIVRLRFTLTLVASERSVVTASRLGAEDVMATPVAVTTLAAAELERLDSRNIEEIAGSAPGLTFSQNTGFSQITIRGIGSTAVFAGTDPSSAFYIDGVYIARPVAILTDFPDLERVEVLRGPQGTLHGRNTIGGAVNIITRSPTFEPEYSMRLLVSSYEGYRARGRVSGPLASRRALGSIAFARAQQDGTVRDTAFPDRPVGSEDATDVRGKLQMFAGGRADITAAFDINYHRPIPLGYFKVLAAKPGFTFENPAGFREVKTSVAAATRTLQYGGSLRANVRLPRGLNLGSLLAYRLLDHSLDVDGDITELQLSETHLREWHHQLSEEITLSQRGSRVQWISGVFLFTEHDYQPTRVTRPAGGREMLLDPHADATSYGLFGQATVPLSSMISATAGIRHTSDNKNWQNAGNLRELQTGAIVPGSEYAYQESMSHSAWTPRFVVEGRLPRAMFSYVSATRGYKSGGYNLTTMVRGRGFAPEHAWTYEAGVKAPIKTAQITASVFHTDHRDLQVQTAIVPGTIDISNAAEATIRGAEVEIQALPRRDVAIGGHTALLDATYDRYLAVAAGGVLADVAGNRLNNAPLWSGRFYAEWRPDRGKFHRLLRAETAWQSTVYFSPLNDDIQRQRPYALLHLAAELGPASRHWRVLIFARNVTHTNYITGSFSSPPPAYGGRPGEARRIGAELSFGR